MREKIPGITEKKGTSWWEVLVSCQHRKVLMLSLLVGSGVGCLPLLMQSSRALLTLGMILGGMIIIVFVLYRPYLGLVFSLTYMVVALNFLPELSHQALGLLILTILVCLAILLRAGVSRKVSSFTTPLDLPMLALLGWALISSLYGVLRGNDFYDLAGDFFQVAIFVIFYYVAKLIIRERKHLTSFLFAMGIPVVVLSLSDFRSYLLGKKFTWVAAETAGGVIYRLQAPVTLYVMIFLILTICLILHSRSLARSILLGFLMVFLGAMLILSFTRSLVMGFLGAGIFILVTQLSKNKLKLALYSTLAILGTLSLIFVLEQSRVSGGFSILGVLIARFKSIFQGSDIATNLRMSEIVTSLKLIASHPLMGLGPGGKYWIFNMQIPAWEWRDYIHNSYLFFALKMGLPGLAIYLWLAGLFLFKGLKKVGSLKDNYLQGLGYGFISVYFGLLVTSLSFAMLHYFLLAPYLGMSMAAVFTLDKFQKGVKS